MSVNGCQQNSSGSGRKYETACKEMNLTVQSYLAAHQIVQDDEKFSDEDEEQENSILSNVIANYNNPEDQDQLQQRLHDAFRIGGLICLVCIDNVKKNDEVWSCGQCYCSFHLGCIQKWAKNSVFKKAQEQDEALAWNNPMSREEKMAIEWCCPNCRFEYSQYEIPSEYRCFCLKKRNPTFDPWLIPHSCGEECNKPLQPECGHKCNLLCHPGKCPPCPIMVSSACYCGNSKKVKRCSNKAWTCNQLCGKMLGCNQHKCKNTCHAGNCDPCSKLSIQKCMCGRNTMQRPCAEPTWQCDLMCKKPFECGHHICEKVCHSGVCGNCPMSGSRKCPCGKTSHLLPCTENIPSCGDTCSKALTCGVHYCMERCHKGSCPSCLQYRTKTCRCGNREKNMACHKNFTCDLKCKKLKDCKRHACNRKCCLGDCSPCEQPCNRMLPCKNHKCESRCHPGLCFPCRLTYTIKCSCGRTTVAVPCGREKTSPKPKCFYNCRKKSSCHHPEQAKHKCHSGDCPPCKIVCNEIMTCSHNCLAPCHDVVPVQVSDSQKRAGPWERPTGPVIEYRKVDHPKCQVPVQVTCVGDHETVEKECWKAKPYSCDKNCGRILRCTNHVCNKQCHKVEGSPKVKSKAGKNCQPCSRACNKPRPAGCSHVCMKECHPGPCPSCDQTLQMKCHCRLQQKMILCRDWIVKSNHAKEEFLSCFNECIRILNCGHVCQKLCHSGNCTDGNDCQRKVTVKCPCKRMKTPTVCSNVKNMNLECNDICQKLLKTKKEEEIKRKEDEEKDKKQSKTKNDELELKKRKNTSKTSQKAKKKEVWWQSNFVIISFSIFIIIVAFLCTR